MTLCSLSSVKAMSKPKSGIALGKKIKSLRMKCGLTQDRLAESAGLSLKHLGEIERGRTNPNLLSMEKIAEALDVPIGELFDLEHEQIPLESLRRELIEKIETAEESECRLLYRMIKSFGGYPESVVYPHSEK